MLIITGISNKKTNQLTIYGILCQNVVMFYRQELASLFQVQEKLKPFRSFSANIVFCIFERIYIYLNIIQWKYLKIALILSLTQIKPVYKFPNFRVQNSSVQHPPEIYNTLNKQTNKQKVHQIYFATKKILIYFW